MPPPHRRDSTAGCHRLNAAAPRRNPASGLSNRRPNGASGGRSQQLPTEASPPQNEGDDNQGETHFLALLFAPLSHLTDSDASFSASAAAAFFAAVSALRAWPAAFLLLPSAPPFLAMAAYRGR